MQAQSPNLRRLLAHAWLGLLLVLGQAHATAHWLSHSVEASYAKAHGTPPQTHCSECDGLVAFGAALATPAAASTVASDLQHVECGTATPAGPDTAFAAGYLSRAPPAWC